MKKIKEYEHHVLYVDEKTNIRESFQYFDLTHPTEETQIIKQNPKTNIKNDNRLSSLIDLVTEEWWLNEKRRIKWNILVK